MNIGVTGQSGFLGYHLTTHLFEKKHTVIPINEEVFSSNKKLGDILKKCDAVVHLAGMNRGEEKEVYKCNVELASQLITSLEENHLTPHLIFSSSTHENLDTLYGQSKKTATDLFIDWSEKTGALFNSLILPNIFGPFCRPYYNSAVATFCYQLTHNEKPIIKIDKPLNLIYVTDVVEKISKTFEDQPKEKRVLVQSENTINVTDVLVKLQDFKKDYLDNNMFPLLDSSFDVDLFNTFRSYLDLTYYPIKGVLHSDERGDLVEAVKEKTGGQMFFSTTKPGKTRGNHYHHRKIERFYVLKGSASIKLRKLWSDKICEFTLTGDTPSFIDIPLFYTHNITNIGKDDLLTLFWTNKIFNPQDPDTYMENVC